MSLRATRIGRDNPTMSRQKHGRKRKEVTRVSPGNQTERQSVPSGMNSKIRRPDAKQQQHNRQQPTGDFFKCWRIQAPEACAECARMPISRCRTFARTNIRSDVKAGHKRTKPAKDHERVTL